MSSKKISALPVYSTPQPTDLLAIVDTTTGITKKISILDFFAFASTVNTFYATAGQTVFTVSFDLALNPMIFVNKIIQVNDPSGTPPIIIWTITGVNEITFVSGLNDNDQVIIIN